MNMRMLHVVLIAFSLLAVAIAAQTPDRQSHGNLNQVMRGILYPSSNVIFDAQAQDPEAPPDEFAISAGPRRPFEGTYGGWETVETSAIALAEAANLLTIPGRRCANGRPVPVDRDDWVEWVAELRAAGMAAYEAAVKRDRDAMLDVGDQVAVACENCHTKYRDVAGGLGDRCM